MILEPGDLVLYESHKDEVGIVIKNLPFSQQSAAYELVQVKWIITKCCAEFANLYKNICFLNKDIYIQKVKHNET